jgi:hypothetical protein
MEQYMREYEEYKTLPPFWGWVVLIVFSFLLITYGMIAEMFLLEPRERVWNFGAAPVAPGESNYNTYEPGKNEIEQQMHKLPGASPVGRLDLDGKEMVIEDCGE